MNTINILNDIRIIIKWYVDYDTFSVIYLPWLMWLDVYLYLLEIKSNASPTIYFVYLCLCVLDVCICMFVYIGLIG